ncbi:hypothetical protein OSB04_028206 [Centaurea solstitialis]|uniref:Integrase zinc-binding domain-containing protein n=1 Tax=Centaurea solstitialis TaxID=347529 RepID=A0AA38W7H9_9ASTR|nr:hypothetical protein OSB04_028206 [Centaurea solstitialis]
MIKTIGEDTIPWYADFANYLVAGVLVKGMTHQQKGKFFSDLKHYFWFKPYLFRIGPDRMPRRCVSGLVAWNIIKNYHKGPTGGHFGANLTARKVLESGFYWPTIFKDAHVLIKSCDACQMGGKMKCLNKASPLAKCLMFGESISWDPSPIPKATNTSLWQLTMIPNGPKQRLHPQMMLRYGCPKAIISDMGTHFANYLLEKTLKRYGVHHQLTKSTKQKAESEPISTINFPGQSSHPPPSSQQSQQSGSSEPQGSGSIREAIQELSEQLGNEHHDIMERLDRISYDMYGVRRELSWVTTSMNEYFESVGHAPSAPLTPHPLWRDGDDAPTDTTVYDLAPRTIPE